MSEKWAITFDYSTAQTVNGDVIEFDMLINSILRCKITAFFIYANIVPKKHPEGCSFDSKC